MPVRKCFISVLLAFLFVPTMAGASPEEDARYWCDNNLLQDIEGIWEYPDDNTRVLIKADNTVPGSFSLEVISTPDCRLNPGDVIGRLYPSIDPKQFKLEQFTRKDNLSLVNPFGCAAILSSDGESIRIKSPKLKFKINPSTILPRFWRLVRVSIDNPAGDLPSGLIKIYPGYDNNGSMKRKIRIL